MLFMSRLESSEEDRRRLDTILGTGEKNGNCIEISCNQQKVSSLQGGEGRGTPGTEQVCVARYENGLVRGIAQLNKSQILDLLKASFVNEPIEFGRPNYVMP